MYPVEPTAEQKAEKEAAEREYAEQQTLQFWQECYQQAMVTLMHQGHGGSPGGTLGPVNERAGQVANLAVMTRAAFIMSRREARAASLK